MNTTPFTGNDLLHLGYKSNALLGMLLAVINDNYTQTPKEDVLAVAQKLLSYPESFLDDPLLAKIAQAMVADTTSTEEQEIQLNENAPGYIAYGDEHIEQGAKDQMNIAMKLPITVAGALMPDAHQGYGLPIGGVLATHNAIIPYGVGVDIGCRMALSVFDIPESHFVDNLSKYKRELIAWTMFGAGARWHGKDKPEHAVLDNPAFAATTLLKHLKDKAAVQLGTSGGGNHFVEWGIIEFAQPDELLNINAGRYLALLTHSGSRGFGATIANHYTKLAKQNCKLPKQAANLAYLDMNSEAGQEYWLAMNLAGDYASACHEVIHQRIATAIGGTVLAKVENHHNFAWKEQYEGKEVIVHRKGATPASKGVMGIIPGSMVHPGYLVRGKGEAAAIHSASHGAGRQMSRTYAIKNHNRAELRKLLKDHDVTLIGGGIDEAPFVYKDIDTVMASQTTLVDVVAKFIPKMVRMADDGSRED